MNRTPGLDLAIMFVIAVVFYFLTWALGMDFAKNLLDLPDVFTIKSLILGAIPNVRFESWFFHFKVILAIVCVFSFGFTALFYIIFLRSAGSLESSRPKWLMAAVSIAVLTLIFTLAVMRKPVDASSATLIILGASFFASWVPFYISTLALCDLIAPGAGVFKK